MAIDPGTRAVHFLPQYRRYSSITKYIARLGLYLHRYDKLFNRAKRLPGSDSKTAAIVEVSKLKGSEQIMKHVPVMKAN